MSELIPYISGVVTLLFGIGFYLGLQEFKEIDAKPDREPSNESAVK